MMINECCNWLSALRTMGYYRRHWLIQEERQHGYSGCSALTIPVCRSVSTPSTTTDCNLYSRVVHRKLKDKGAFISQCLDHAWVPKLVLILTEMQNEILTIHAITIHDNLIAITIQAQHTLQLMIVEPHCVSIWESVSRSARDRLKVEPNGYSIVHKPCLCCIPGNSFHSISSIARALKDCHLNLYLLKFQYLEARHCLKKLHPKRQAVQHCLKKLAVQHYWKKQAVQHRWEKQAVQHYSKYSSLLWSAALLR